MKKKLLVWMILGASMVMYCDTYAQEKVNLNFLFDDWVISDKESTLKQIILRKPGFTKILSKEDLKTIYTFKIGLDSVVCTSQIKNYSGWICGSEPISSGNGLPKKEVWSLNYEGNQLTRGYYFGNNQSPVYASIYRIVSLNHNYLKLQLLDEVFN